MGDRANVYIHEGDKPGVYVYTHWYGTELPDLVTAALETPNAKSRADDYPYLTRILIEDLLTRTSSLGEATGWGVSTEVGDGDGRIVDVNVSFRNGVTVTYEGYDDYEDDLDFYDEYDETLIYSHN